MTADRAAARPRLRAALAAIAALLAGCDDDPTAADPVCADADALTVTEPVNGELVAGDLRFQGVRIDYYGLRLTSPARVELTLRSSAFDPVLLVFAADGAIAAQAFDAEGRPEGEEETAILVTGLGPGCHLVGATGWGRSAGGPYVLTTDVAGSGVTGGD